MSSEKTVGISKTTLDNGLVVLTEEIHDAPVVAIQAWVNVGSADETEDIAGVAHLHEHMLFKGTERRGVGEIARTIEASGGDINAWTSFDQTVYHVVLAAAEADTGLDVLSDALRRSSFDPDELAREIEVVCEEIHRAYDSPSRRTSYALFDLAYTHHPYRRPVLGSEETVRAMGRERIRRFFGEHYRPDAITLVAVGDFSTGELLKQVETHFGDWHTNGSAPVIERAVEPEQRELRLRILEEDVKEARLAMAWHIPGVGHEDIAAIDALSVVLGHGDSSRLHEETRQKREVVNDVYAYAYTPREPGLLMVGAGLKPEKIEAALGSMLDQVFGTREHLVSSDELEKAKVIILSESAYQRETVQGQARKLGFFEVVAGDYTFEAAYREQIEQLTPEDLRAVARKYFGATPSVVIQVPESADPLDPARIESVIKDGFARAERRGKIVTKPGKLGVTRVELDSGAVLLVKQEDSPVLAMRATALGGLRYESRESAGIGNLFATLWGAATEDLDMAALARKVATLGGGIGAFSGRNSLGLRGEFIREKGTDGLQLFCDALLRSRFTPEDFERERAVILERIKNRSDNPSGVAFDAFADALYPTHPYGVRVTGTTESVSALGLDAVVAYGERLIRPDRLIVSVVGGIEVDRAVDILAKNLEAGEPGAPAEAPARDAPPAAPVKLRKTLDRNQAQVIIGGMGSTLDDPARFAIEVLTTVLSGQSGRLFVDLRDKQSLAYSVSAGNLEGLDPGYVMLHMGTSPDKVEQGLVGLYAHLERLMTEPVTAEELERAQRYLVGSHAIDLQRCGARAMTMVLDECFGLGYDDHAEYAARIQAVTADAIQEVARRYYAPRGLIEVVVGPES